MTGELRGASGPEDPAPGLLFAATCDLVAIVRGRAVPATAEKAFLDRGVGWVPADLAMTGFGHIADDNVFGAAGDLRLLPDSASAVDIAPDGEVPGMRVFLADQVEVDGSPWPGCPRGFLRTALQRLYEEYGLRVLASFEHEFVVHGAGGDAFSLQRLRGAEPFGSDLVACLEQAGFGPENWLPEYGSQQFEITLAPADGLVAADRAILLRELVRDLARRRGLRTSFAPILEPGGTGNGVHVHLSLIDDVGEPVLAAPGRPGGLSALGQAFCDGIVAHAPALSAIAAPSVNSYLRLRPHTWSAGGAFLAERSREALLRICPGQGHPAAAGGGFNLEYRAADATANPWLVLGALVHAGLAGLSGECVPTRVWPPEVDVDQAGAAIAPLPSCLGSALDALERDEVAVEWFPPVLLTTFLSVKRAELDELSGLDDAALCRRVSDVY